MGDVMREFDSRFLAILVCPISRKPVVYDEERDIFICRESGFYYVMKDGIPDLRSAQAHRLSDFEPVGASPVCPARPQDRPLSHP